MFVHYNSLKGFYSGMFISETTEASYCGLPGTSQNIVDESNNLFAQIVGEVINEDIKTIYDHTKLNYQLISETNPVALYNHNRLYLAE